MILYPYEAQKNRDTKETLTIYAGTLSGDNSFELECSGDMLGKEFWRLLVAQAVAFHSQKTLKVSIGAELLKSEMSLAEQGLRDGDAVTLVYANITEGMQEAAARKLLDGGEVTVEELHVWHSMHVLSNVNK